MDRNTVVGLVLIAGIILTWSIFFGPEQPKQDEKTKQTTTTQVDSTQKANPNTNGNPNAGKPAVDQPRTDGPGDLKLDSYVPEGMADTTWAAKSDSEKVAMLDNEKFRRYGHFAPFYEGENKDITIETDKYLITMGTKGGYIRSMYFKDYTTSDSLILPLVERSDSNYLSLYFTQSTADVQYPITRTKDFVFVPSVSESKITLSGDEEREIAFRAQIDDKRFFELVYIFRGDDYDYDFKVRHNGLTGLAAGQDIRLHWKGVIPKTEKAMALMRDKTAIYYRISGDVEWVNPRVAVNEPESYQTGVDWFAFKSQFFSHTIMSKNDGEDLGDVHFEQANPIPPDP
ncbi:MAG: membrane protein insertase YidC, partial [Bacteroidota bacterium]